MEYAKIYEAMEQFKRDHPEYEQAKEALQVAREAMEVYQRYLDGAAPKYTFIAAPGTDYTPISPISRCGLCNVYFPTGQFHFCYAVKYRW